MLHLRRTMEKNTEASRPATDAHPDFDRFEVWKQYEQLAMHFNDLLMRLRTQSLAAVGAFAALAGIILKAEGSVELRWGTVAGFFALLISLWIAVWILDFLYYNRLLRGAVDAILKLEKASEGQPRVSKLELSTLIEDAVTGKPPAAPRAGYWARTKAWWCFYFVVLIALVCVLCVSCWYALKAGQSSNQPPQPTAAKQN